MNNIAKNKFSNKEIAHILKSIAAVYLLTGQNRFRIIAYEKATDSVEHLTRELKDIWQEGKLFEVPGIGSSIGSHLDEYFKTGKSNHFVSVLNKVPSTVFKLMEIPTVGPKKAYKLVKELKLLDANRAIGDLKKACMEGEVAKIESFGEKSQQDILEAIKLFELRSSKAERMPLPYAYSLAKEIIDYLKKYRYVKRVDALGSLRRMVTTIGDVDVVVVVPDNKARELIQHFLNYPKKIRVDNAGGKKASIMVQPNIRVDLRVEEQKSYGSMLQYFTGSKAHNIKLREFALKKNLSLSEYGIKKILNPKPARNATHSVAGGSEIRNKSKIFEFSNEKDFYKFLALQYIPPEIREGTNEIELALKNKIPRLIESKDVKGDLHIHSSYNLKPSHDLGKNSYEEILEKADQLGYQYVGFADHNPKVSELSESEVVSIMRKRKEKIVKTIRSNKKTKYFIGLEVDILPDGKIALPEKAFDYVDYLIVSIHSSFNQDIKSMTKRVVRALNYPKVKIFGHPTARLLGKREGIELDWKEIFLHCKKKNIALEINSWPERLDLPDTLVREGSNYNIKYIIDTDAHAIDQMKGMFYGVSVARRGWCKKNDIINTLPYADFRRWLYG